MNIIAVITTKNRTDLFAIAYESICKQTRQPDRIIVVSDSTIDNTAIERSIIKTDTIFIEDTFTNNYAGSLNSMLDYIIKDNLTKNIDFSNTYIATLDDDDYWEPSYLSECESSVKYNEDFVVTGIRYIKDDGILDLSIPKKLSINSFLEKNPHIQGSNTFIKMSTLLLAGAFDENMSSTTDRDIFTRVMMLSPTYSIVDKHLVNVNASNLRNRITNNKKKEDGLRKYYYKYSCLMNDSIKNNFFDRAKKLFCVDKENIEYVKSTESNYNPIHYEKKYTGSLMIGYIATDYELGLRLLKNLISLKRANTSIIIFINFINEITEYENLLSNSNYNYKMITKENILLDLEQNPFINKDKLETDIIRDIAVSRTILQHYLYQYTKIDEVVWVLDDDMELYSLYKKDNSMFKETLDIDGIINMYKDNYDGVIGGYSLDAPLPTLSTIRSSLLDYTYHYLGFRSKASILDKYDDYYYDLSDYNRKHLETPIPYTNDVPLDYIFSGKANSRPLFNIDNEIKNVYTRGGNTLIFNKELLKIPNWSIEINNKIGRRSDYYWCLVAKNKGYKLAAVPFSTCHNKKINVHNHNKELQKLLLDLIGSSFTKTIDKLGLGKIDKRVFFDEYKYNYTTRLSKFIMSYYRIIGLLKIIKDEEYIKYYNINNLKTFIKECMDYITYENVITAYENLISNYYISDKLSDENIYLSLLKEKLNINTELHQLGYGNEGVVFTDFKKVYKIFFYKPDNIKYLKEIANCFNDCVVLYPLEFYDLDDFCVISYEYEESLKYTGGYHEQLAEFIRFSKKHNFIFDNIKSANFIVTKGGIKLVDYGKSFKPFDEKNYIKLIDRTYEMIKYPNLSTIEFKKLVSDYYNQQSPRLFDYGKENFINLINKRYKEECTEPQKLD